MGVEAVLDVNLTPNEVLKFYQDYASDASGENLIINNRLQRHGFLPRDHGYRLDLSKSKKTPRFKLAIYHMENKTDLRLLLPSDGDMCWTCLY